MKQFVEEDVTFTMPLTLKAHQAANHFRQQQTNSQKAKQVYLNTLAVQAVNSYLSWLGIETNLTASDSWNPMLQSLADTADLIIKDQGKLECRPVLPGEQTCQVPPEVWSERIGYVAVQFDTELSEATLLGFVPSVAAAEIPLSQLRSLDELLDHLMPAEPTPTLSAPVKISQWLQNVIEVSWQTVEDLLGTQQPAWGFRSANTLPTIEPTTTRGKLLHFPNSGEKDPLALLIGLMASTEATVDIWVKVRPLNPLVNLPAELELLVLDEAGVAVMQAQSRNTEMIQLKFKGMVGETFSIKVALGSHSFTEDFVI